MMFDARQPRHPLQPALPRALPPARRRDQTRPHVARRDRAAHRRRHVRRRSGQPIARTCSARSHAARPRDRSSSSRTAHHRGRRQAAADGGWVATHQDITEERRRQASFRFLFENNPLPMWVWDHETLRFLAVNTAAEEKYGYDRETFLRLTLRDIKRSSDWSSIESTVDGDESGLREGQTTVHAKADGSLFDVAFYGRSMNYEGRAASLVTLIDITERKRAEDELRRTRTFLDTIVENMPAILTVKDARDKRYVLVNRAASSSFGVPGAEMSASAPTSLLEADRGLRRQQRPRGRRIRDAARRRGATVRDAAQRRAPVQHQEAAGARRGQRRAIPAQPVRGHHRPQARARPDRAHGASRPAHRPAEPRRLQREARRDARRRGASRQDLRGAQHRPRPVQGGQRRVRPRGRRRAAVRGRTQAARGGGRRVPRAPRRRRIRADRRGRRAARDRRSARRAAAAGDVDGYRGRAIRACMWA